MLHIPGYDLFATTISAKSVGGDYYDFLQSTGPGVSLCVGDVSGKGMPASMLMANLQATLRASFEAQHNPAKVLEQSNRLLYKSTSDEKFATVFLALLDSALNELRYANAGHDPAMLLSADGTVKHLAATGIPVGMFDAMEYGEAMVEMKHFDVLLIFSDGITESMDAKENQFGRDRILDSLLRTKDGSAAEIGHGLLEEVAQFSKGMPQSDDRTILILKRV
jgi:sigma-B regulation protein RsbU (phosphoserine phosphatase)